MENPRDYYKRQSPMTAPGAHAAELRALPTEVGELRDVVQGVLIHRELARWLYDVTLAEHQLDHANIRPVEKMIAQMRAIDSRPLRVAREPAHRLPSVCRHFSVMLSAILREQGVPARARCGFGAYFNPGKFEDHWVCEYWNSAQARWILVDAQLDAPQRKAFKIDFNPLDVPRDRFIIAGDAWQMCRARGADADRFGLSLVPHLHGLWFVAGNVVRDLASLNSMEMLPWDVWGLMEMAETLSDQKKAQLDRVAALTLADDGAFPDVRAIYADDRLRVPPVVFNAMRQTTEPIAT